MQNRKLEVTEVVAFGGNGGKPISCIQSPYITFEPDAIYKHELKVLLVIVNMTKTEWLTV